MKRYMAFLEDSASAYREVLDASVTAIEFTIPNRDTIRRFTEWANRATEPTAFLDIEPCGFLIWKHLEKLKGANCCVFHRISPHIL